MSQKIFHGPNLRKHLKTNSFYYLEPDLKNAGGHTYISCKLILEELKSRKKFHNINLLIPDDCPDEIKKELSGTVAFFKRPNFHQGYVKRLIHDLLVIKFIYRGIYSLNNILKNGDVIYLNTAMWMHLFAIIIFKALNRNDIKFVATLRLSIEFDGKSSKRAFLQDFTFMLLRLMKINIVFVTDSNLLKREYEERYNIDVKTLPIPHIPKKNTYLKSNNITVSSLGPARGYKGSLKLLQALRILDKRKFKNKERLFIVFHIFGEIQNYLQSELETINSIQIKALNLPRSLHEYELDLNMSDIIFCAYDKKMYAKNTSGIFFEACALNKIPLISANTWAATINEKYNCARVVAYSAERIAEEIQTLCTLSLKNIKRELCNGQRKFVSAHGCEKYCSMLLLALED